MCGGVNRAPRTTWYNIPPSALTMKFFLFFFSLVFSDASTIATSPSPPAADGAGPRLRLRSRKPPTLEKNMPPSGLELPPFPAAAGTSESAVIDEGGTAGSSAVDAGIFSPRGGNERVHNTRTCVHPSAMAAWTGTGSITAASTSRWPRHLTGSGPAKMGTAADALRHCFRSSTPFHGPSSTTGVRVSSEVATTLRGTRELISASQFSGRVGEWSITPSTR
mmetsp:Transcript_8998/g.40913  ORF Transcript_8998/g.40913 Transcript_8998/m.40913 type:complete len:221 (-) Transcript_8998:1102-1764(-)